MTQVRATVAGDNPHPRPSPDTQRRLVRHGSDIQRSNLRDCSSAKAVAHGTKYVVENAGTFVRRFIELPNGKRIALSKRKALICKCAETVSIVPDQAPEVSPANDPRVAP